MRRWQQAVLIAVGGFAALAVVVVLVLTQTSFGRERIRLYGLGQLARRVQGVVDVARIEGNPLSGMTLIDVAVTDSAGQPFLRADTVAFRYSLRSLFRKHLIFQDVRLVRPVLLLDQQPGQRWNFERLFRGDTVIAAGDTIPGFGDWVRLENVTMVDGDITVRSAWAPSAELSGEARTAAVERVLSAEHRVLVVQVPGGYQTVSKFREVNGRFPLIRLADPDSSTRVVEIAQLSALALPFRPPEARLHDARGLVVFGADTVQLRALSLRLPSSQLRVDGWYSTSSQDANLRVQATALAFPDVRFAFPALPDGGGRVNLAVARVDKMTRVVASEMAIQAEGARLAGLLDLQTGAVTRLGPSDLHYSALDTRLLERLLPAFDAPVAGVLAGHIRLAGVPTALRVDGWSTIRDRTGATSRIEAAGVVGFGDRLTTRNLRLDFDPLQVRLLRRFQPTLPLDGTITGYTTLNGAPAQDLSAALALRHQGSTGTSAVTGRARLTFARELREVETELRVSRLALATVGSFVPAAGLRGTASGTVSARGSEQRIVFTSDLAVSDGGEIGSRGTLGFGGPLRYDVSTRLSAFDPAAVSTRAPAAMLSGTITAVGSGTAPASANALVEARLVDSRVTGVLELDSMQVRARLADGLATFERGHVGFAAAGAADVEGSFGLVAGRSGELRYRVAVDTLAQLPGLTPGDTGLVPPRPLRQLRRIAQARADSASLALETEVERAATGRPALPTLRVDSVRPLRRDSVAGSVQAEGVLAGNIERFTATGTAVMQDVVFRATALRHGRLEYQLARLPAEPLNLSLTAALGGLEAGGFAFDSAHAVVEHRGSAREGESTVDVAVFQDPSRDYRLNSAFTLALDRKELRIRDLTLRFDSTVWQETQPGRVSWAAAGVELDRIELQNGRGGHLLADGRMPTDEGSGDLRLEIDSLQVGDVAALLQDTMHTRGLLSLSARVEGSARAPRLTGELELDSAARAGQEIPSLRGTFAYAARELSAQVDVTRGATSLLTADVALPMNLALSGREGPLLLADRPLRVTARADSLPLEALPTFTTAVSDVRGRVAGDIAVRGTFDAAEVSGQLDLTIGSLRVVQPGVTLTDGVATLRLSGERATLDSLVARSGGGTVRAAGTVDVSELRRPGFDLTVSARDAVVLDDENGRLRADATLTIAGPYEQVRVTGDIAVQRGVIYVEEPAKGRRATNLDDPTLANVLDTLQAAPGLRRLPPPILRNLQADIGIRIARDTWVRNPTANVEIYTPEDGQPLRLTVDNARQAVVLEGTINADRGEYTMAGRQFELTTGSATFLGNPDPDPLLQLSAQYQVPRRNRESLIIQINIGGYLSEPRISLSSNAQPPLPESDLISYLAFGRSSSSLLDQGGSGITGAELGLLAEQQLAGLGLGAFVDASVSGLEEQGARAGLDVFRVHPAPVPDELNFGGYFQNLLQGMELEAGKYLSSGLFLSMQGRTSGTWPGLRLESQRGDGFGWRATWEPAYLPHQPSLADTEATRIRVFGAFLLWSRRF